MSAWIVSKRHIDALVYWLDKSGISKADKDALGGRLWSENYRSIRARYGDRDRRPTYHYEKPLPKTSPSYYDDFDPENIDQIQALVHCYDYQTCEHDEYEGSPVQRMIIKLDKYLTRNGADWKREGTKAPWGI